MWGAYFIISTFVSFILAVCLLTLTHTTIATDFGIFFVVNCLFSLIMSFFTT